MKRLFVLVDDDAEDAELFADALDYVPIAVDFRHVSGCEGLFDLLGGEALATPDLIFLDLNMPRMTGWECLDILKRQDEFRKIPVVIYSTSSTVTDKARAVSLNADGYLPKPGSFQDLVVRLRRIAEAGPDELAKVLKQL